jgi:hypothetical protein
VLHKGAAHHDIAHLNVWRQSARHAGKHHAAHAKSFNQRGGRGRCRHLANARQHRHHLVSVPMSEPKLAASHHHFSLIWHTRQDSCQLFVHGTDQRQAHQTLAYF